jgi:AAT family amino acid transporter/D-serine/D-alanine/glycine transporter
MPGAPIANWLVLAFLVLVALLLAKRPDTRVALYVAPFWFGLLIVGYALSRTSRAPARAT